MSTIDGVTSLQARVVQLSALINPAPTPATTAATSAASSAAFSAELSSAMTLFASGSPGAATSSYPSSMDVLSQALFSAGTTGVSGAGVAGAPAASTRGDALVESASKYLGVDYVWGGESMAEGGVDCSGLVQLALKDMGVTDIPRVARDQQHIGTPVASMDEARPGDLLVFDGGTHIGIYAGDGKMVHASYSKDKVVHADVYETPTSIRRLFG